MAFGRLIRRGKERKLQDNSKENYEEGREMKRYRFGETSSSRYGKKKEQGFVSFVCIYMSRHEN